MNPIKTICALLISTLFLALFSPAHAFHLSSQKLDLKQGEATSETIRNTTDADMTVKVSIEREHIRETNGVEDCSKALRVFPKVFEIKAGKTQDIRLISREPGMCRVYFLVDSKANDRTDETGNTVSIILRVGVPVSVGKKEVM